MTAPTPKFEVAWGQDPLTVPTTGEWTDETTYLRSYRIAAGRSHQFDPFSAGECEVVLDDLTRRFDPNNADSPLSPNVRSRKRVRLSLSHPDWDATALDFDGTTGDYALKSSFAGWPSTAMTLEMFLTGEGAASGANAGEAPLTYYTSSDQVSLTNLRSLVVIIAGGSAVDTNVDVLGDKSFPRHLAIVWRSSDGMLRVYVDGAMRYDGTYQTGASMGASGTLVLGQEQDSAGGGFSSGQALKGMLRDVRIWNVARTQHAICSTMKSLEDPAGEVVLDGTGDYVTTPDHSSLDITGDIDIRWAGVMTDWTPVAVQNLVAKRAAAGVGNHGYTLRVSFGSSGRLDFIGSPDGSEANVFTLQSSAAPPATNGEPLAVRVTVDVNNGSGGKTATFYYKATTAATAAADCASNSGWTQLGTAQTSAGTTSLFNSTAALGVGAIPTDGSEAMAGSVYAAVVKNGIDGTTVADPDFTVMPNGATTHTDTTGKVWTLQGGATVDNPTPTGLVSRYLLDEGSGTTAVDAVGANDLTITGASWSEMPGDRPIFTGFIESFQPRYVKGAGADADAVQIVRCTDMLGLMAHLKPRRSPYRQAVIEQTPALYWPLDEAVGVARDISGNGNNGTYENAERAIEADVPLGDTQRAVQLSPGDRIYASGATVAQFERTEPFSVSALIKVTFDDDAGGRIISNYDAANTRGWGLTVQSYGKGISGALINTASTNQLTESGYRVINDGGWHHVAMTYDGGSGTGDLRFYVDGYLTAQANGSASLAATIESASNLFVVGTTAESGMDLAICHVAVFAAQLTATQVLAQYEAAFDPWAFQRSDERVGRLLDLAGVATEERDLRFGSTTLAPVLEPIGSVKEQLDAVALSELGAVYVRPDGLVAFDDRWASVYANEGEPLVFGDDADDIGYSEIEPSADVAEFASEVRARRVDGPELVAFEETAETDYVTDVYTLDGLWSDNFQTRDAAEHALERRTEIDTRFETLQPSSKDSLWRHLPVDLNRRVTVEHTPPGGGADISQSSTVQRHEWASEADDAALTVVFGVAPDAGTRSDLFVVGRSALDGTVLLP